MTACLTIEAADAQQLLAHVRDVYLGLGGTLAVAPAVVAQPPMMAVLTDYSEQALLDELTQRMSARGFVLTVSEAPALPAAEEPPAPAPAKRGRPKKAEAEAPTKPVRPDLDLLGDVDLSGGGDAQPEADPEDDAAPVTSSAADLLGMAAEATDDAHAVKLRTEAFNALGFLLGRGAEGLEAIRVLRERFQVEKFADVPMGRTVEMHAAITAAKAALSPVQASA